MGKVVLASIVFSFVLSVQPVFADGYGQEAPAAAVAAVESAKEIVKVGNKICPVSGEKAGEMGEVVEYEYNGKIYNLCCGMCVKDFEKDPGKYSKIADDEVAASVVK